MKLDLPMDPTDVVKSGLHNYCPFCGALAWSSPALGSRVLMLSGYRCGETAEVVELDQDPDVLVCKFDTDPDEWTYRENRRHELILPEQLFLVPSWAPPISVEDAGAIHASMLFGYAAAVERGDEDPRMSMIQDLMASIWRRRLPLQCDDISPMLAAHGWASDMEIVREHYSFGLNLLTKVSGNRPVKRKRMPPFSSFTYQPASRCR